MPNLLNNGVIDLSIGACSLNISKAPPSKTQLCKAFNSASVKVISLVTSGLEPNKKGMAGVITTTLFGVVWLLASKYNFFSAYIVNASNFTSLQLFYTFTICFFSGFGLLFFVRSMQYEKVSIVVPLSSVNIFSILTATFLLHEAWQPVYTISLVLIIVGVWLVFANNQKTTSVRNFKGSLYTSLLASFFWGISYALFKIPIKWVGALTFSFILELSITFFALVTAIVNGTITEIFKKEHPTKQRDDELMALEKCIGPAKALIVRKALDAAT